MQEDGHDEAVPLVWGRGFVDAAADVGVRDAGEAAEFGEGARDAGAGCGGCIGTRPEDVGGCVLNAGHVVHAGLVARAHVY